MDNDDGSSEWKTGVQIGYMGLGHRSWWQQNANFWSGKSERSGVFEKYNSFNVRLEPATFGAVY